MSRLRHVLLVDDNEMDNLFHSIVIERADVTQRISTVESGAAALDLLREPQGHDIDLILLDLNMPGMDGFEFADAYARLPEAQRARIVVVMLTSSPDPHDLELVRSKPIIRDYLTKPLTVEGIAGVVARYFGAADS